MKHYELIHHWSDAKAVGVSGVTRLAILGVSHVRFLEIMENYTLTNSRGESALETTAQEILKILKRLFDARSHLRTRIFTQRIDPLIDQIRESHNEFIFAISKLQKILRRLDRIKDERISDIHKELDNLDDLIGEVADRRHEGRTTRRELFSETKALLERMNEIPKQEALALSDEEKISLEAFLSEIQTYLSKSDLVYAHDLGSYLVRVDKVIQKAAQNEENQDLESERKSLYALLESYLADRESRWLQISEEYAKLKHSLPK